MSLTAHTFGSSTDDPRRTMEGERGFNYPHQHLHQHQHHRMMSQEVQCANCGGRGHMYRMCDRPVSSFGIVCFRVTPSTNAVEYMLVQRKDSLAYVEFIRGKYSLMNTDYIVQMLSNMTRGEQDRLVSCDGFESWWSDFWQSDTTRNFVKEYEQSHARFTSLRAGYPVLCRHGVSSSSSSSSSGSFFSLAQALAECRQMTAPYDETEFGFPKGRRNINESDVDCACREFSEETGIPERDIRLVEDMLPFEETFWGSNHVRYRHTYFVAQYVGDDAVVRSMPSNQAIVTTLSNPVQMREIRALGWFDADGVMARLRMHYIERRALFREINNLMLRAIRPEEAEDADVRLVRRHMRALSPPDAVPLHGVA
jgi:8-oxo-dGTP pyrophosphatase MutT (NUDIX family)